LPFGEIGHLCSRCGHLDRVVGSVFQVVVQFDAE